jgi:CheY-like chemotaxis protein
MLDAAEILNASILIVDDQEDNVVLLEEMLRNDGYKNITTTQSPREVLGLHEKNRFDLILLDLQMPKMDGFEVIEELKTIQNIGYLPVLVITAQPGHKLRALKAGAKDFVSKPFDFIEVQTRIRNMLEVRLLYRRLDDHNRLLEKTVLERTAALRLSEARFQRFTELSSDWYWEQDATGKLTQFSGPVEEMLGIGIGDSAKSDELAAAGWNVQERAALDSKITNREPFLDFIYTRTLPDARVQYLQVSGEPMFDAAGGFAGYRGIGLDVSERMRRT